MSLLIHGYSSLHSLRYIPVHHLESYIFPDGRVLFFSAERHTRFIVWSRNISNQTHSKRVRSLDSSVSMSFGGLSLEMMICFPEVCKWLKVWKNSSCVLSFPIMNWISSINSTSLLRYLSSELSMEDSCPEFYPYGGFNHLIGEGFAGNIKNLFLWILF